MKKEKRRPNKGPGCDAMPELDRAQENHCGIGVQGETSSPPNSIPNPVSLPDAPRPAAPMLGLPPGGTRESKFSLRRASLAARGVLAMAGVRHPNAPWAGLGVTLTKSAKLKFWFGVLRPYPNGAAPGVVITDDGKTPGLEGGVVGGKMIRDLIAALAGEGEVARYSRRSAPSSPAAFLRLRNDRAFVGGGVRGGEERKLEACIAKECRRGLCSSSSDPKSNEAESGMSDMND